MHKKYKSQKKNFYDFDGKERATKIAYKMAKSRFIENAFLPTKNEVDDVEGYEPPDFERNKTDFKNDSNNVKINY